MNRHGGQMNDATFAFRIMVSCRGLASGCAARPYAVVIITGAWSLVPKSPAVAVAGNEASAESEEATEIEPSTALEDTAISLESERAP